MKIDLFKLNNLGRLEIDEYIEIPKDLFGTTGIRDIKSLHISGILRISMDEVIADLELDGTLILGCAVTLDDVPYEYHSTINDSLGNFDDIYNKNKQTFDILPFIWGDIAASVPIRVVKDGVVDTHLSGKDWEVVSE